VQSRGYFFDDFPGGCDRIGRRSDWPAHDEVIGSRADRLRRGRYAGLVIAPALSSLCWPDARHNDQEITPAAAADQPHLFRRGYNSIQAAPLGELGQVECPRFGCAVDPYPSQVGLAQAGQYRDTQKSGTMLSPISEGLCPGAHHGLAASGMEIQQAHVRQFRSGRDRSGNRIGDIVVLQVKEYAEAKFPDLANCFRAFRSEEVNIDFEQSYDASQTTGHIQRLIQAAEVERQY
jgi:hypothetical protein